IRLSLRQPEWTFWAPDSALDVFTPDPDAERASDLWRANWQDWTGLLRVRLDAWDDLFRLGPVEDVQVNTLWHFRTVLALRQFLGRPSLRVLRLDAAE